MMAAIVLSVNPLLNQVRWSGLTSDFRLSTYGDDITSSEFVLADYEGENDDIIAAIVVDGRGYLTRDERTKTTQTLNGPADYYGVVTAVSESDDGTFRVTTSDLKTLFSMNYVPEKSDITNPYTYIKYIYDRWRSPTAYLNIDDLGLKYTNRVFVAPNPTSAQTATFSELLSKLFSNYQVVFVPCGDNINTSDATLSLHGAFTVGEDIGSVLLFKCADIQGISVYVRPTMNGEPNGIAVCVPNDVESTEENPISYEDVEITKHYIKTDGTITNDSTDEDVIKPIKMTSFIVSAGSEDASKSTEYIAQRELSIPAYAHEISFKISKWSSYATKLAKVGTICTLLYMGKSYRSIVRGVEIDSASDYITIVCGNVSSALITILDARNLINPSSTSGKSSSSTIVSPDIITDNEIDALFDDSDN